RLRPGVRASPTRRSSDLALPRWRYEQTAERAAFYDALLERLRNTPGIEVAALGSPRPFSNQIRDSGPIELPGRPPAGPGEPERQDRKSTRLNSSHVKTSY